MVQKYRNHESQSETKHTYVARCTNIGKSTAITLVQCTKKRERLHTCTHKKVKDERMLFCKSCGLNWT